MSCQRRRLRSRTNPTGFEICLLMTDRTAHRRKAKAVVAARDRRLMSGARVRRRTTMIQ